MNVSPTKLFTSYLYICISAGTCQLFIDHSGYVNSRQNSKIFSDNHFASGFTFLEPVSANHDGRNRFTFVARVSVMVPFTVINILREKINGRLLLDCGCVLGTSHLCDMVKDLSSFSSFGSCFSTDETPLLTPLETS